MRWAAENIVPGKDNIDTEFGLSKFSDEVFSGWKFN